MDMLGENHDAVPDITSVSGSTSRRYELMYDEVYDDYKYILKIVVNIIFGILILFGNILTLVAIALNKNLRTPTNRLIASLSCADILCAVPLMTLRFLVFLHKEEQILRVLYMLCVFCMALSLGASISTILAIAIDRYIAVLYPFKYRKAVTDKTVSIACAVYWTYNIIFYLTLICVFYWNIDLERLKVSPHPSAIMPAYVYYGTILWQIVLVQIIVIAMYVRIFLAIRKQTMTRTYTHQGSCDVIYKPPKDDKITKATHTTAIVVLALILCWMPFTIISLFATERILNENTWMVYVLDVSTYLVYANSFMNPMIYAFRCEEFRNAYKLTLTCEAGNSNRVRAASQQSGIRMSRMASVNSESAMDVT